MCWRNDRSRSSSDRPPTTGTPSAWATVTSTSSGSRRGASETKVIPSSNASMRCAATSIDSLVLPIPPGPVIVRSRMTARRQRSATTLISWLRPTKAVSGRGQVDAGSMGGIGRSGVGSLAWGSEAFSGMGTLSTEWRMVRNHHAFARPRCQHNDPTGRADPGCLRLPEAIRIGGRSFPPSVPLPRKESDQLSPPHPESTSSRLLQVAVRWSKARTINGASQAMANASPPSLPATYPWAGSWLPLGP